MNKTGPHVLIIPDSFKDSISSVEFCEIANNSVLDMNSNSIVDYIPMGDAGRKHRRV